MSKLPTKLDGDYASYIEGLRRRTMQAQADAHREQLRQQNFAFRHGVAVCFTVFFTTFLLVWFYVNLTSGIY